MSILSLFYTVGFMSFISILSLSSLTNTTDSVVKLSIMVFALLLKMDTELLISMSTYYCT